MKKKLTLKKDDGVYYFKDGIKIKGLHPYLRGDVSAALLGDVSYLYGELSANLIGDVSGLIGDVSGLIGDVSGLRGDVSNLRGDVSGLYGDCTNIIGNICDCEITDDERRKGINIQDLLE